MKISGIKWLPLQSRSSVLALINELYWPLGDTVWNAMNCLFY